MLLLGSYLLQDATGGSEAPEMFVDQFCRHVADLLIGETLDGVNLAGPREEEIKIISLSDLR